jgi:hypothetical protein
MPSQLRLILLCAAYVATLASPSAGLAQAGPAAGTRSPQTQQQPGEPNDGKTVEPPAAPQQRSAPSGCPYRDGKLELIV